MLFPAFLSAGRLVTELLSAVRLILPQSEWDRSCVDFALRLLVGECGGDAADCSEETDVLGCCGPAEVFGRVLEDSLRLISLRTACGLSVPAKRETRHVKSST